MQPRWRRYMYNENVVYRGGTETFDIATTVGALIWIVWDEAPFNWEAFKKDKFRELKPGDVLEGRRRITAEELRDLRNYVNLFVPEFAESNDA